MRRSVRRLLTAGALLVAVGGGVTVALRPAADGESRELAPAFAAEDLADESRMVSLKAFAGKPVVLNFWASWCTPCRRELPALRDADLRWGDDVAFVGMAYQDSRRAARAMLKEFGIGYPSGYDPKGDVARAYGLVGMPTTIFISADRRIVKRHTGELRAADLSTAIRMLGVRPRSEAP